MLEMLSTEPKVVRIVERAAQRVLRGSRVLFNKEQMLDDDDELASRSSFCKKNAEEHTMNYTLNYESPYYFRSNEVEYSCPKSSSVIDTRSLLSTKTVILFSFFPTISKLRILRLYEPLGRHAHWE